MNRKQITNPDPNDKNDKSGQKLQQVKNIEVDQVLKSIDEALERKPEKQESCICC